jgi:Zn-dependent M28 family amino/carboxypeptidase
MPFPKNKFPRTFLVLLTSLFVLLLSGLLILKPNQFKVNTTFSEFNGESAYQTVRKQLSFGARYPGSDGHQQFINWIQNELLSLGWQNEIHQSSQMGLHIFNVVAKRGDGHPWIILGTHYDTRQLADRELKIDDEEQPVPGANDGASGVAVLLELARILPSDIKQQLWLVFFDAEDNGQIEGLDWALGSRAFVNDLENTPDAVVIIDMIGDADLNIYREANSNSQLTDEIWMRAEKLGYDDYFINQAGLSIVDDHTPFIMMDIPAVLIIDINYPYWHTTEDTADKISAHSLKIVGDTLYHWLIDYMYDH